MKYKSKGDKIFDTFIIITVLIFCAITLIPILNIIASAFSSHSTQPILLPVKFDLFSIKTVLTSRPFYNAFLVSIIVTLCGTIISVLAMSMAAYALSKRNLPFRSGIMIYFMITMLFSGGMIPNYILMSSLKFTNTLFALILPSAVQVFHLILMKNFFEGLPDALEESAKIDGAGNLTILFKIIFPISMSMIVTVSLFTAVVYWNNYFNALLYISASSAHLYPLPFYIINLKEQFRDPNAAITLGEKFKYEENIKSATIILSMLPIVCAYPYFLKYFTKGVIVGAEKG